MIPHKLKEPLILGRKQVNIILCGRFEVKPHVSRFLHLYTAYRGHFCSASCVCSRLRLNSS